MTTKIYYSKEYSGAGHAFDTTRKSGWINSELELNPIAGVEVVAPSPITVKQASEVHSPAYIKALRTGQPFSLASSAGFGWDENYWRAIAASSGGTVAAAVEAFKTKKNTGSLSSGIHHASYDRGMGFCSINSVALAAVTVRRMGAKRILVVDTDAHCGGGTFDLLGHRDYVDSIDISTSSLDSYEPNNVNSTLDVIRNAQNYLTTFQFRLEELTTQRRKYDLILYGAGMDPAENCSCGGMKGMTYKVLEAREKIMFDWARSHGTPVAFTLAGGYTGSAMTQKDLVELHRLTISAAAL